MIFDTAPTLPRHPGLGSATAPPPGTIPRVALLRRLLTAGDAPLVLMVAPAGYGKTTLVREWAQREPRPFVWSPSVEQAHAALAAATEPRVIAVDGAEGDPGLPRLLETAIGSPPGLTLALATRVEPDVPLGRLRAHRQVLELRTPDLAMNALEAVTLLDAAGLHLHGAALDRLLARTKGWPALLYLAALAAAEDADPGAVVEAITGGDRLLARYLRDELLTPLDAEAQAFLRRTSILEQLAAPACDAVAAAHGSGLQLAALARAGLPLEPLDRLDLAFRHHPLVAEMLRTELRRTEHELEPELHRRAARWFAETGEPAIALDHAAACGDTALAGRLLWSLAPRYAMEGRSQVVAEWLERLGPQPRAEFALAAAVAHLAAGRGAPAERATDTAQRALARTPVSGGEAAVALLHACIGRDGLEALAADARRAGALLPPESPWQALVGLLLGVERHLADDHESARVLLEDAVTRAAPTDRLVLAVASAQLALLAAEDGDWEEADRRSACAYAALVGDLPPAPRALVLATATLVAAERGEISRARHDAADANRILAAQPDAPPWLLAEAQLWLARAQIKLSDGPAARALLARSARLLPRAAGESALTRWLHDGWARADAFAESATGDGPMLTNAELRVLRLLPSHMTFREIGARLHVSTNTVKTQALAVYRKLDVSCRSDAVSRGRAAGLIGGA